MFVKEVRCKAARKNFKPENPYESIFFEIKVPFYDVPIIQLTGSRVHIRAIFEDGKRKKIKDEEGIGTVLDNRSGTYKNFLWTDFPYPVIGMFARLDSKEVYEKLKPFSFDSEDPNDRRWLEAFNIGVAEYEGEFHSCIPAENIMGYELHPSILDRPVASRMLCEPRWPPTEAYLEFFNRKNLDSLTRGNKNFAPDRTTRSNDLLTVSTIVKRKASHFTEEEVVKESAKYGSPLVQIPLVQGLSTKYALVDRSVF